MRVRNAVLYLITGKVYLNNMANVEFEGQLQMKKMIGVTFTYEDGTQDEIVDIRACLLFQSRINSSGIVSGMGAFIQSKGAPVADETQ